MEWEYRGNLHVHTDRSDGSRPLKEIAQIAARAGLDFVGINDHHVFYSEDHYTAGVLMLMGTEYNSSHNHYLAYAVQTELAGKQLPAAQVIDHVRCQGGLGIVAHPCEQGSRVVSNGAHYPWRDWDVAIEAMEIWNCTSQWRDAIKGKLQALLMHILDPFKPLKTGPSSRAISRWEQMCRREHVTAVAGSDLHGLRLGRGRLSLEFLGYKLLFAAVNNYVLLGEPLSGEAGADSKALLKAIGQGNCYIGADFVGPASGFRFKAEGSFGVAGMGQAQTYRGTRLVITCPKIAWINLLKDGKPFARVFSDTAVLEADGPGIYRVEVYTRRQSPWIYSNPIYLQ